MCGECINKFSAGSLADNLLINLNIMKKIFVIICLSTLSSLVFSQAKLEIFGSTAVIAHFYKNKHFFIHKIF